MIINIDAEEEPNETDTIALKDDVMVKYVHYDDLDDNLDKDDEDNRNIMSMDGRFPRSNSINIGRGNLKTYDYQHRNINIQTTEQGKKMMVNDWDLNILGIIMTHYSLNKGSAKIWQKVRGMYLERTSSAAWHDNFHNNGS